MQGFRATTLPNGTRYVAMYYTADEDKRGDWGTRKSKGVPAREWMREMEMADDIYDGEPVFADYRDSVHCPWGEKPLPVFSGSFYSGGWDCGATLIPSFVLLQCMSRPPFQIHSLLELVSDGKEPMSKFVLRVLPAIRKLLPGTWDEIEHWGDATVTTANGANGETAQQAAKRQGIVIKQSTNAMEPRMSAVTWLLTDMLDDKTPRFVVDGNRCPVLRAGFLGAYKIDVSAAGDAVGPGRVLKSAPLKNSYSHVQDALQYAAMPLYKRFARGKERKQPEPDPRAAITAIINRER